MSMIVDCSMENVVPGVFYDFYLLFPIILNGILFHKNDVWSSENVKCLILCFLTPTNRSMIKSNKMHYFLSLNSNVTDTKSMFLTKSNMMLLDLHLCARLQCRKIVCLKTNFLTADFLLIHLSFDAKLAREISAKFQSNQKTWPSFLACKVKSV